MEAIMQRMEFMITKTSEAVMKSVTNQINDMNTTVKEMRKEGEFKFEKIEERIIVMEAQD